MIRMLAIINLEMCEIEKKLPDLDRIQFDWKPRRVFGHDLNIRVD